MKGLTTEMKEQVRSALIAYCENYPTRNRAAESLQMSALPPSASYATENMT